MITQPFSNIPTNFFDMCNQMSVCTLLLEQDQIIYCNQSLGKLFGIDSKLLINQNLTYFFRFLNSEFQEIFTTKIIKPTILNNVVIEFFDINKQRIWVEIQPKYINIESRRVYLLIWNNITNYILENQKLKKELNELDSFINNAPDLIWIVDKNNNIIRINISARATLFSLFQKDFSVNCSFIDNLPVDIQGIWRGRYRQVLDGNDIVVSDEFQTNGQKVYFEFSFLRHFEDEKICRISVVGRDITDFKRLTEQLKESNINRGMQINDTIKKLQEEIKERKVIEMNLQNAINKAETANRAKIDFLANMSHELRTPLNAIIGFSDLLAIDAAEINNCQMLEFIENIGQSGRNLLTIISEILELTNIESGHIEINPSEVNLEILLKDIIKKHEKAIQEKNLTPVLEIQHDNSTIVTDKSQLTHILDNLISNAIKFTSEKGKIGINVEKNTTFIQFSVWDTGIGIANEHLSVIFQPFKQIENAFTKKYGGTGLGLYVCKKIIDLLGGKIWVESQKNLGSKFKFTIPIENNFIKEENPSKILFIGLDKAGKTSLIDIISKSIITEKYNPSTEIKYINYQILNKKFVFIDCPGQKLNRILWDSLYEQINVVIFIIDASDRFRFNEVEMELCRIMADPLLKNTPLIVTMHKFDLESAVSSISNLRALIQNIVKDREVIILNTSVNIPETIEKLKKTLLKVI